MIRGDKVLLRALERSDVERCHRWFNDPAVVEYLPATYPVSMAQEQAIIERQTASSDDLYLAIEAENGQHIGSTGLHRINRRCLNAELRIAIGEKEYWGKGYGTDAVKALSAFGFDQMNLHKVYLYVFDFNLRGIACYRRCGFRQEGAWREHHYYGGKYCDVLTMGLLRAEFEQLRQTGQG
ncbi:MAG: GNAT family N-acetyltransferase [Chloroflexi bacterium]|nr:GNAT family N-acetyltransferase [Chloroflexota bacterium]